jgi:hypothetical protein
VDNISLSPPSNQSTKTNFSLNNMDEFKAND